jgi:hypothetical protein
MRKVAAAVCFLFAGALLVLAGLALSQVWDPQAESADSVYVEVAAAFGLPALVFLAGGIWALRSD